MCDVCSLMLLSLLQASARTESESGLCQRVFMLTFIFVFVFVFFGWLLLFFPPQSFLPVFCVSAWCLSAVTSTHCLSEHSACAALSQQQQQQHKYIKASKRSSNCSHLLRPFVSVTLTGVVRQNLKGWIYLLSATVLFSQVLSQ